MHLEAEQVFAVGAPRDGLFQRDDRRVRSGEGPVCRPHRRALGVELPERIQVVEVSARIDQRVVLVLRGDIRQPGGDRGELGGRR